MTTAEFKAAFPAFAATADSTVQAAIDAAAVDPTAPGEARWGTSFTRGLGLWVAHEIELGILGPTYGVGSSSSERKKVGDVEVERRTGFNVGAGDDPFDLTSYGKRYKRAMRLVGFGMVAV
jgi:hypothetical protein